MSETDLRRCTERVLGVILRTVQESLHPLPRQAEWLGNLSTQVGEILRRDLTARDQAEPLPEGVADELALTAYLTLAAAGSRLDLEPAVLVRISRRLSRELNGADSPSGSKRSQGGREMRRTMMLTAAIELGLLVASAANATPEFGKQWAANCGSCHVGAPTGLDEEGVAFRLAGFSQDTPAKVRYPKYFFSVLSELVTATTGDVGDDVEAADSAQIFGLYRLDKQDRFKIFAIAELREEEPDSDDYGIDLAHGHLQVNPLAEAERFNLRIGNVEPMTRLWNSEQRRVFESPLWSGVNVATGSSDGGLGGHDHAAHGSGGPPGVLPISDWGGDISSVVNRNLLVTGGYIKDVAFGGVFFKRGGRGFDNSTVPSDFDYNALTDPQRQAFNTQQTNMAKKWERSVIFGLSAYSGMGTQDVFDGSAMFEAHEDEHGEGEHGDEEHGEEEHGDEHGDEHGEEEHGEDEHGDEEHGEEEHHDSFFPTRVSGMSRVVGEVISRWDRYGFYLVGVFGDTDYVLGDSDHWAEHLEFERTGRQSRDFFAWAFEASASFNVTRVLVGRAALRYEALSPEDRSLRDYERVVANLTIPIRMMRPAIWPYLELVEDIGRDDFGAQLGFKLAF